MLAVLVVKDGARWIRSALAALARQTHPRLGIVAVDNASTDESSAILEGLLGRGRVLRLERNLGFPGAVAAAMRLQAAEQADHLLLLHDDVVLEKDAVARLVSSASSLDGAAVIGPKILREDRRRVLLDVGRTIDRFGSPYTPLEDGEIDQGQYDTPREVLFVSSTAMLVGREVWQRIGPPDERLGPAHADLDYGWRARSAGYRVVMDPRAVAYHRAAGDRGERAGASTERGRYLQERATLTAMLKNYRLLTLLWLLPAYVVQSVAKVILFLLLRRFSSARQSAAAWAWAFVRFPGTIRRRVRAQAVRRAPDREVTRFMVPAATRLRRWMGQVTSGFFRPPPAGPVDLEEVPDLPPLGTRVAGLLQAHPVATALSVGLVLGAIAFREVLFASPLEGGSLPTFPDGASDLFGAVGSGWSDRLGAPSAINPALAALGAAGTLTLGDTGALTWLIVATAPFLAAATAYRATLRRPQARSLGSSSKAGGPPRVAGIAAGACYALSAVAMWAVSEGRLSALALLVGLPWLAMRIAEPFDAPVDRPLRWSAGTALGLALVGGFAPSVWIPVVMIGLTALIVGGEDGRRGPGLGMLGLTVALSAALVFPLVAALMAAGGAVGPSFGPVRELAEILRLSPAPAPGSWLPALFLPIAGFLGFAVAGREDRRIAWRAALAASVSLVLAWLAGAGRLPSPLSDPPTFIALAAWSFALLVGLAFRTGIRGVDRLAFGGRQIAVVSLTLLVLAGVGAQASQALRGDWAVGEDRIPPAWPLVETAHPGVAFRVLWLGDVRAAALPPPGGPADRILEAGPASVAYAVTGREGRSVTSIGIPASGPGYDRLEVALRTILSGRVRHGGALLAPLGVGFVVAGEEALPEEAAARLGEQLDLLGAPRAGGLIIYQNTRLLPIASVLAGAGPAAAARSGDLLAATRVGERRVTPLRPDGGAAWVGAGPEDQAGVAYVATEHDPRWRLEPHGGVAFPAFGWGVGFDVAAGADRLRLVFDAGWPGMLRLAALAILWAGVAALAIRGREEPA